MRFSHYMSAFGFATALGCAGSTEPLRSGEDPPGTPAATPSPTQALAEIAFHGFGPEGAGVFLKSAQGIQFVAGGVWSPAWSPDGNKLLFSNATCDTDWETYIRCERGGLLMMDYSTRTVTPLANGALGDHPAWAPSGDMIAFARYRPTGGTNLYVMRLDGSEPREIPTPGINYAFSPAWSPDGMRLVFDCHHGLGTDLCIVHADGTGLAMLPRTIPGMSMVSGSWSPDGKLIAFTSHTGAKAVIGLMAPDGSGGVVVTEGLGPTWSPDGKQLGFSRNNVGLFTINRDGSNLQQLITGVASSPAWRPARQ